MVAFDQGGNVRWMVPNEGPLLATADGGVIGVSGITYDQNGNATGQSDWGASVSPGWFTNIVGTVYSAPSGATASLAASSRQYATSFGAFQLGSASHNGSAIQQVMNNHPQTGAPQLPDLSSAACLTYKPTCGNLNAIELLTTATPDYIFQNYIQTYAPVTAPFPGASSPNAVMTFTGVGGSNSINVTPPPGQIINIGVSWWAGGALAHLFGHQNPFQIMTQQVDPVNHLISVVTLTGHPLAGYRYWRVYSIGTNDVVIETGAYDQPGPGPANYSGYYLSKWVVSLSWERFMEYIQGKLQAPQGTHLQNSLCGISYITTPRFNVIPLNGPLLEGYWDYSGAFTSYIMNNVNDTPQSCN